MKYKAAQKKVGKKPVQNLVKLFLLFSICSAVYYFSYLLNPANISNYFVYTLLVIAEIYIFIQSVGVWYTLLYADYNPRTLEYYQLKKKILREGKIEGGVAIFITVHNEPVEMVRKCLASAAKLAIEHNTYLLNDHRTPGDHPEYKKLAEEYGATYIKLDGNTLYKVGNLNWGLKNTKEKYIANFDCDYIIRKNFLVETLPFFADEELGFVQTPQNYRNRTNLISKGLGDAVNVFYNYVLPAKNSFGAAPFLGTNALFRREALESTGGWVFHHSEDVFTGYQIHQKGWKSIYIPEVLARGIAPEDTESAFKQQLRWSGGSLEIFLYDSVFRANLTLDQKFQYFTMFLFYLCGIVIFIMILNPILYLLFGIKPLNSYGAEWLMHYGPYFIVQFISIVLLVSRLSLPAMILSLSLYPVFIKGFINAVRRKHKKWSVTNGSDNNGSTLVTLKLLYWHMLTILITVIALIVGYVNVREVGTATVAAFWAFLNTCVMICFIVSALRADRRKAQLLT